MIIIIATIIWIALIFYMTGIYYKDHFSGTVRVFVLMGCMIINILYTYVALYNLVKYLK